MDKNFELFFDRLKKATKSDSDQDLSNFLGLKKSTLSMWKSREVVNYGLIFKKFEQSNLNYNWLLTGAGPMLREGAEAGQGGVKEAGGAYGRLDEHAKSPSRVEEQQLVPLYDMEARAGIEVLFVNDSGSMEPVDHIRVPGLPKCDGAVYVSGDSMYPTLHAGDIVLYKIVYGKDSFLWGCTYLLDIDTNGDTLVVIKQVQKGADQGHIRLVSQNTAYQPIEIGLDHVRSFALVKAYLRKGFLV